MDKPAKCKVRQWMEGCNPSPSRRRAGVMIVDVQALGVDFIAASGHTMCGPTGIGFL